MQYTITGNPIPLARPRFGANGSVYDSQKRIKSDIAAQLVIQHNDMPLIQGPIGLTVSFYMPIPKSLPKYKRRDILNQTHTAKPDLSNLVKMVEDVANGIIYRDDALISFVEARKIYSDYPRTEFEIVELK